MYYIYLSRASDNHAVYLTHPDPVPNIFIKTSKHPTVYVRVIFLADQFSFFPQRNSDLHYWYMVAQIHLS